MNAKQKITTGPNERPRNETIAQTGPGIPGDTSRPIEATDEEVAQVKKALKVSTAKKDG